MRGLRIAFDSDRGGDSRIRALAALLGTITAILDIGFGPLGIHGIQLPIFPASIMIVMLLGGWRLGGLSLLAIIAGSALLRSDVAWQVAVLSATSAIGGEALRRGMRPVLVAASLMVAALACEPALLRAAISLAHLHAVASSAVLAALNVAMATCVLVLIPRRSTAFPKRRRIGWNHIAFVVVVGTFSTTVLGVLGGLAIPGAGTTGTWGWRESFSARLALMVATAVVASMALAWWCERASRRLPERFRQPHERAQAGVPRSHRSTELPREIASFMADLARDQNHLRHDAERNHTELLKSRRILLQSQHELQGLRELLKIRSSELTETTRASRNLRARHALMMEISAETTLFTDGKGQIEAVSNASHALLGYQPADLVGKHISVLIPADGMLDHPLNGAQAETPAATALSTHCPVQAANGGIRDVAFQITQFTAHNETGRMIVLRETDHMKKALAVFERAKEVEHSARRSRDLFIATMSHEMRTPLHGLIATLDMMRANEPSTDFQHQLAIARTSARALLKIANDVLDLTRVGSNLFQLERQTFGMSRIVSETVDEARARATSMGLSVSADLDPDLPKSFVGDPARLKQILANLVSNALKFTAQGSVTLSVRHDGKNCILEVRDTGEGIPADKRDKIFEPFVQLPSRNRPQVGGTGLGLPISRRLAEAMGGQLVLLQSGPQGSTFRLTLPLESSEELPPDEQSQRVFRNPRGRVLVVEDNSANRYVAQALLSGLGCPATIVDSGHEALELLRHQEFDLILMDCQLPGMDGYETTRRARRIMKRRVPIIAITANAMVNDRSECLEAGMDDFLPKPFGRQALSTLLCKWLTGDANDSRDKDIDSRIGMRPDLDVTVLDELWESLRSQPEPLKQIRSSFIGFLDKVVMLLDSSAPIDKPQVLRHLHTALGSAGMVGARQIEFIITRLQGAVKEDRIDELKEASVILERAMRRYDREFHRWFRNGEPGRAPTTPAPKVQRNYA